MAASARGLFRATGKTAKPVAVSAGTDLAGDVVKSEFLEREQDDFYPTPPEPTLAFLAAEGERMADFPAIWEPACGNGAMAELMKREGHNVICSDLVDRGYGATIRSFYDYREAPSKALVTNPPFQECHGDPAWVRHALENLGIEYMALLLPLGWPGAKERSAIWAQRPPARIYLMRWRIDFTGQGAPPMLNAWFVWDGPFKGNPELRMLDKCDPAQFSLIDGDAA